MIPLFISHSSQDDAPGATLARTTAVRADSSLA
jgi:hypothetical protein